MGAGHQRKDVFNSDINSEMFYCTKLLKLYKAYVSSSMLKIYK